MWLSQVELLSQEAKHFCKLGVDLCKARADAPVGEENAEKGGREGFLDPADAKRELQVVPQVSKQRKDSSFAIAIFLRSRSLCGNVLLALRAATRTGVRVAAYRLCALSQVDERVSQVGTFCLFSRNLGVLRTQQFYR